MTAHKKLSLIITTASLCLLLVRTLWPGILNIDAVGLGLIVLAASPWLAPLIKSIEVPGFGKIELQELYKKAEEARGAASSADLKAEYALAKSRTSPQKGSLNPTRASENLASLMEEYNHIRLTQSRGPARTSSMTTVVSKMISIAESLNQFDVQGALSDVSNAGRRLAGYCWLYAKPNPDLLTMLVNCLTKLEDQSFAQYWAIQALAKLASLLPEGSISSDDVKSLQTYYDSLPRESERSYDLERLLVSLHLPPNGDQRTDYEAKARLSSGRWERASGWKKKG